MEADSAAQDAANPSGGTPTDATRRFTSRVADYVAARPHYPAGVLDVLRRRVGLAPGWVIADAGSGTGISAELFLSNGNTVYAVEPNDAMRSAAEERLGGRAGFHSVAASAESTGLPGQSIDLVVAAQAFHWFDPGRFRAECRRVLRPGAWVLLMWNDRQSGPDAFSAGYETLLRRHGTDYERVAHRRLHRAEFDAFFGGPYEAVELANAQALDSDGLRRRLLSSSYVPQSDDPRAPAMLADLQDLFDRHQHAGRVTLHYLVQMYFGPVR